MTIKHAVDPDEPENEEETCTCGGCPDCGECVNACDCGEEDPDDFWGMC